MAENESQTVESQTVDGVTEGAVLSLRAAMGELNIEKLGSHNYVGWAPVVKSILVLKDLWAAVDPAPGTEAPPVDPKMNEKALAVLILSVEPMLVGELSRETSAREAWKTLRDTYQAQSAARQMQLSRELQNVKMARSESVTEYIARVKDVQAQLIVAGSEVSERMVILAALSGLPEEYEPVVMVLQRDSMLKMKDLVSELLPMERRLADKVDTERVAQVFYAGHGQRAGRFSDSVRRCWCCNAVGHLRSECPKWKAECERNAFMGHHSGARGRGEAYALGAIADSGSEERFIRTFAM